MTLRTINPSTTSSVLTSITTCSYPSDHGIVGYEVHDYEKNIDYLPLKFIESASRISLCDLGYNFNSFFNLKSIFDDYKKKCYIMQHEDFAYSDYSKFFSGKNSILKPYSTIEEAFKNLEDLLKKDEESFIYLYFSDLDQLFHKQGINSRNGALLYNSFDSAIKKIYENEDIKDVTISIIADHGHLNMKKQIEIFDLYKYFTTNHFIDSRVISFSVKEELKEEFLDYFNKKYSNDLVLLTKEEIEEIKYFGPTKLSDKANSKIGDYIALVKNDYSYVLSYAFSTKFKGDHSGLTKEEIEIPLIVIKK